MIDRFLTYSLEHGRKISAVLMMGDAMVKKNLLVTAIDADGQGFTARLPGRKREVHFAAGEVLTCAYARGDQGELEQL
ncbi:MAG: hypothetical protein ACI4PG_11290 [Candidatus Ventricola sp.]